MKIGIYDPYLTTLGGGEKYMLSMASCLSNEHEVSIFWDRHEDLQGGEKRFNLDLSKVNRVKNIFLPNISFLTRLKETRCYDAIIYLSDGSIPLVASKKLFVHFQFPVEWVNASFVGKLKQIKVKKYIVNSLFTKQFIDKKFKTNSIVLYPPIMTNEMSYNIEKKEKIILSVGRFTRNMNTKKQDVLIEAFKKMHDTKKVDWKLILFGGMLPEDINFVKDLEERAKGYPITIKVNQSYDQLVSLYEKSSIYWHAAGYGEDLGLHPERAEHFGISTVEAMSAGCIPVVFRGGGQIEIIQNEKNGYMWEKTNELIENTLTIISNSEIRTRLVNEVRKRAKDFTYDKFTSNLKDIVTS